MTEMLPATRLEVTFLCEQNTLQVVGALQDGPLADSDIVERTGVGRVTVRSRLQRLESLGVVARVGERRARAQGKRAQIWALTDAAEAFAAFSRYADAFVLELLNRRGEDQQASIASRRRDEIGSARVGEAVVGAESKSR
jgi:predicted ArsR family transcriptional regulator